MHLWAKKTTSQMDHLTASVAESLALYGPEYAGTKPDPGATREAIHLSAFKNYAMAEHRPDLAKYTTIAKNDYDAEFTGTEIDKNLNQQSTPYALIGFILWRADVLLLLLLAGSILVWLLSTLVIKVLFRKDAKIHHSHSSPEYWRGALSFVAWPMSVILLLGYSAGISHYIHQAVNSMAGLDYQDFMTVPVFSTGQLPSWWIPLFGIVTPFLFGINHLLRRAAWLNRPADFPKTHWGKRVLIGIFSLLFVIFWADCSGGKYTFLPDTLGVGIGVIIGVIALVIRWRQVQNRQAAWTDFLNLLHGSTLRWLALGSILYLMFLAASIPARRPIRAYTLQKVIKGELPALLAVKNK
jgi:hypothetical protein